VRKALSLTYSKTLSRALRVRVCVCLCVPGGWPHGFSPGKTRLTSQGPIIQSKRLRCVCMPGGWRHGCNGGGPLLPGAGLLDPAARGGGHGRGAATAGMWGGSDMIFCIFVFQKACSMCVCVCRQGGSDMIFFCYMFSPCRDLWIPEGAPKPPPERRLLKGPSLSSKM
jgi:hypothetical protein